jgi:hypothetical protein
MAVGIALAHAPARAQLIGADFTRDELKCQNGTATAFAKLLAARAKCLTNCYQDLRDGSVPATDCAPPAFGGGTASCLRDAVQGVEAKALATLAKVCAKDCPECYANGDCTAKADSVVSAAAAATDSQLVPFLYCGMQSALTAIEAKCQDSTMKRVTKLAGSLAKCAVKCKAQEAAGKVPAGSCAPPAADPATSNCIQVVQGKASAAIDKACSVERPACYPRFAGLLFAGLTTTVAEGQSGPTYCGFPSIAFGAEYPQ